MNLLLESEKALHVSPKISVGRAWMDLWEAAQDVLQYDWIAYRETIRQTGSGIEAMAVGEGDVQTRTFPGDIGLYKTGGWEIIEQARLRENAGRIAEEAVALLWRRNARAGRSTSFWGARKSRCRFTNRAVILRSWIASWVGSELFRRELSGDRATR